ncbi:MAG: ABC transporter substrate-binding protein [Actinomycetia bacterium]|nr:ABC transporter substrate-binding protein [Actinomycetes bacterium]
MTPSRVRRLVVTLAAAVLALAPATAAAAETASPAPAGSGTTFTVGILQDITSVNPFTVSLIEDYEMIGLMYDSLVGYSATDFSPVPRLAESWEESDDQKTWTYKIRSGVTWSDGVPLTAKDAAYTFNRIINGDTEQTNFSTYVANIAKAEAPDDTTLVLTVTQPNPLMTRLAVPILPQHVWEEIDGEEVSTYDNLPPDGAVGSGPFRLVEYRTGQFVRFTTNKDYYDQPATIDELVFRIFTNEDAAVQALQKGEIDFLDNLTANPFIALEGAEGITRVSAVSDGFSEIAFNVGAATVDGTPIGDGHPALKDPKFRAAVAHAIDKDTLLAKVARGFGAAGSTVIPPLYTDHLEVPEEEAYPFDIAKANELLDAAGYRRGTDGIRTMPDGSNPLKGLRLFARQESPSSTQTAQFVVGWLKQLGIDVTVQVTDEDNLGTVVANGEFDMFEWGWGVEPDPSFQLGVFTCDARSTKDGDTISAGLSDSFYCNPEYDRLYAEQGRETDPERRTEIVKQMQQILYTDAPYVLTTYDNRLQAYRSDRWEGFVKQPAETGWVLFTYGTYSYRNIRPVSAEGSDDDGGLSTGAVVAIGAGVIAALAVGGVVVARRRSAAAEDRE